MSHMHRILGQISSAKVFSYGQSLLNSKQCQFFNAFLSDYISHVNKIKCTKCCLFKVVGVKICFKCDLELFTMSGITPLLKALWRPLFFLVVGVQAL